MRILVFAGLFLMLAGCCAQESASVSESADKAAAECKQGDCCSSVSRASLLNKATPSTEEK
jgi:hypothetical protein